MAFGYAFGMLARLELHGFKSFAERTRFDFAPGISAVVGPNGSGKSNIVDAVKWVLGEQSAKSLRGGEMADVIFNGSSTRKAFGLAEVSATFNNKARILGFDGDEVTITRRVYRDGQGEYLINGEISRLKDIRELLLGSGAGQGAYSIIEQGRVDALLTTSTKDRRAIFEEAAGISRFKAKKIETLRKLDHVETDLSRVKDIVLELDKQLRTLQLQAAKAQKYREYADRLKTLRLAAAAREFSTLTASLTSERAARDEAKAEAESARQAAKADEAALRQVEWELSRCEDGLRHQASRLGDARQQLATADAQAKAERQQASASEAELLKIGRQRATLTMALRDLARERTQALGERDALAEQQRTAQARVDAAEANAAATATRFADLSRMAQSDREAQFEAVDRLARLQSVVDSSAALVERHRKELTRKQAEAEQLSGKHDALAKALDELSTTDINIRDRLDSARSAFATANESRDGLRTAADSLQPRLDTLRNRRSELAGRVEVLDRLDKSFDGFGAGVQAVAERYSGRSDSPVIGLVADLLTVPREVAPLIDVALGDLARSFVVRDEDAIRQVVRESHPLTGRVGLVPLNHPPSRRGGEGPPPLGTIAATAFVTSEVTGLVERLLGDTAIADSATPARPGVRIVTRNGELIEPDGRVTIGPLAAETGLLSRKSELRELIREQASLDGTIRSIDAEQLRLRTEADSYLSIIRDRDAEIATLSGEAGSLREQILRQRENLSQLADRIELLVREADILALEVKQAEQTWSEFRIQADTADEEAKAVQQRLAQNDIALTALDFERSAVQAERSDARVQLARVMEQVSNLAARIEELESAHRQKMQDEATAASEEQSIRARQRHHQLSALRATADAADGYRIKEDRERTIAELMAWKTAMTADRERTANLLVAVRQRLADAHESSHSRELTVQSLQSRLEALTSRIRDDYGVDLANEPPGSTVEFSEASDDEMESLKQKIAKLGSVNLEAVAELAEVEQRATTLKSQYDDLVDARRKLMAIIEQINGDSRRLFTDTLNAVRTHFQDLFRKLFGGGMADIVLEDESDVLESGIEITARPPGKELRSIALLSGGEKTMTAVALLLAIFRNRPSPFCLLDEVDAALDEANTTRFAGVIREFLDRSQFIVITHKKRTMAAADVLYGVTMQESGVSKQVAVKFEDWPDDATPEARQAA
jgi:chromosome segregation protein